MRVKPILVVWHLILGVAVISQSAQAQSTWSGSIAGGYATGLDNNDYSHGSVALALDVFRQSARKLSWGAELGYSLHENRSEVIPGLGTIEYRRSAWHFAGMLRLRAPRGSIRPYGLAGIGVYALDQDRENFVAPGLNVGTGIDFYPRNGRLGIGASARLHMAGRPMGDTFAGAGFLALMLGLSYQ
jgi:hypothetical protein